PLIYIGVCWAYVLRTNGGVLGALAGAVPLYELVCVGAAAGVSTAFGAPVGGVLFAVEELGSVRSLSQSALLLAFTGSFTASFMLKSWNLYGVNRLTFFALSTPTNSPAKEWGSADIFIFLILGIIGGLVGSLFIRFNLCVSKRRKKHVEKGQLWFLPARFQEWLIPFMPRCLLRSTSAGVQGTQEAAQGLLPPVLHVIEAMSVALVTSLMNYPFTRILSQPMVKVINGLFETCPNSLGSSLGLCDASTGSESHGFATSRELEASLLLAAAVRLLQTALTFGALIPSGLFIPSLYVGAAVGRTVGLRMLDMSLTATDQYLKSAVHPGVFAMVGAIAMLSGFARLLACQFWPLRTVSLVVIMLELTGELNYAVPFMCAVLAAKLVGDAFTVSIYDGHGALLGFANIEDPEEVRFSAQLSDVAVPLTDADIVDVSKPIRADSLIAASEVPQTSELQAPRTRPDVLVLVAGHGQKHVKVCGVVEKAKLLERLQRDRELASDSEVCRFVPNQSAESATDDSEIDLSDLVQTDIRRMLSSAPLLTAVCAFREYPDLHYCVCRCEVASSSSFTFSRCHPRIEVCLV
ncbi:unnamed protein product, partial [Polarella glacialis]